MNSSAGVSPAEASWELEHSARIAEKAWLEEILTSYDAALGRLDALLGEHGSLAEDAPPRLLRILSTLLQKERTLIQDEHTLVERFCTAADEVLQLRDKGDEGKARGMEQQLHEQFWSYESGWMGEWSGWTGERQRVGLGGFIMQSKTSMKWAKVAETRVHSLHSFGIIVLVIVVIIVS
eukprot:2505913-Amphidinium_carterae.1